MMVKKSILAIAIAFTLHGFADPFNGQLVDHSNQPVANAKIKVRALSLTTEADEEGHFTLDLPLGRYVLDIEAGSQGHFHQTIDVTGTTERHHLHIDLNHANKVVITANPLEHTKLDMAAPAVVLSGEELTLKRSANLGEMLQLEPGMSMSSFGPAVSRPVIRGLSGGRVVITNNQLTVQDASTTSADHDVALEPLLAEQIEVLKGPATLLYGSGAIGGVVNIKDGKINPDGVLETKGGIELRLGDSVTGEQSFVGTITGGNAGFAWHLDFYDNHYDDITIPGHAESSYRLAAEGDTAEDNSQHQSILENSRSDSQGGSIGLTWNGSWGYWGMAINHSSKLYGVPGHQDHQTNSSAPGSPAADSEEDISIDMEQTRYELQASVSQPIAAIKDWFIGAAYTDYQHQELEGVSIGTRFNNEALEIKSYLQHTPIDAWDGIVGVQITERDFAALGDEAFVPPSITRSESIFAVEEKRIGSFKLELGARLDHQNIRADGFNPTSQTSLSFSSGMVYDLSESSKLAINIARAERSATAEELYSFGEHAASQTFEVGNPKLTSEKSLNLDLSYRFHFEGIDGEINGYWNQFGGFIYGAYENNTGTVVDLHGNPVTIDDQLPVIRYQQQDAAIRGIELNVTLPLIEDNYGLALTLLADFLEAELDSGDYLPRMPSLKYGAGLKYDYDNFTADLTLVRYNEQKHTATNELPTDGFVMADLELAYRLTDNASDTLLFVRGRNLLDEEARDHTSFLKDLAPRAGRNFVAGVRYSF
jgi:iron complex outermembrane receptor protein